MDEQTAPIPDDGPPAVLRDAGGRFLPGSASLSPGRPPRETEQTYLRALSERVTLDDWNAVIEKALAQAKGGDSRARNFLASWLLPQRVDLTQVVTGPQAVAFVECVLQLVVSRIPSHIAAELGTELRRQLSERGFA